MQRLPTSGALAFHHLSDFHKRAHDRHRIRAEVEPLTVSTLFGEPTVKFGLNDDSTLEDREQLWDTGEPVCR